MNADELRRKMDEAVAEVRARSAHDDELYELSGGFGDFEGAYSDAVEVIELMRDAGATIGLAESLTGGLVTAALTSVPGSSAVVRGGLVVYASDLKVSLAGVSQEIMDARGPVDPYTAVLMASGARVKLDATHGLSVTGVAGPEPQDGKPVGTVYVGIAAGNEFRSTPYEFSGNRAEIRQRAVAACLRELRREFTKPSGR